MSGNTVEVAVLAGDGIGPEVTEATLAVLDALARRHALGLRFTPHRAGAMAYQETGEDLSAKAAEPADA